MSPYLPRNQGRLFGGSHLPRLELTPRFEMTEALRAVVDPILFDEVYKPGSYREAYPWFFRLSAADQAECLTQRKQRPRS